MKIKAKVTTDVDMEISLPYFCKYGEHYTKVISESKSLIVSIYSGHTEIGIKDTSVLSGIIAMSKHCTGDEFNTAFNVAFEIIQNHKMEEAI